MKNELIALVSVLLTSCIGTTGSKNPEADNNRDTLAVLQNNKVILTVSLYGGAITGFTFKDDSLNPFTWKLRPEEMPENNRKGAPFQGHFLCIGRWGSPTDGEKAAGIPHNGEPSNIWWEKDEPLSTNVLNMSAQPKLEQLSLHRTITLSDSDACFVVDERLSNNLNTGIFTAIVQHATIGTPFLDEKTIVSSNASYGFNQSLIKHSLTQYGYQWPDGYADTLRTRLDLTKSDQSSGYVSTHILKDDYGWITAANTERGLLTGYLWKTSEYPWLHIWHGIKDGKLWAKGLEFGTTGLGDTFTPEKRAVVDFHGVNNNQFIDAKSSIIKKYLCFLTKIPSDFIKTDSVTCSEGQVIVNYLTAKGSFKTIFNLKIW